MNIVESIKEMKAFSEKAGRDNKSIGFVPTMGCLHNGHISLIKEAKKDNDYVVVSIFVNPIQFVAGEDYNTYPRPFNADVCVAQDCETDILFFPKPEVLLPNDYKTYISVDDIITKKLCGASRPGHFRGVTTIIAKLFNIIRPNNAYFGEKDYQQLAIIKQMAGDLNYDVNIIGMPIIRELDGLAISSRNSYLDVTQRKAALCLFRAITKVKEMVNKGELSCSKIVDETKQLICSEKMAKIDYIKLCNPENFEDQDTIKDKTLFAIAVKIGETRLIDNYVLEKRNKKYEKRT